MFSARQVVDVVVLGDDVAVGRLVGPVDGAVDLQDHAPLLEGEVAVVRVLRDRDALAVRPHVHEAARLVRLGGVDDDVDLLAAAANARSSASS